MARNTAIFDQNVSVTPKKPKAGNGATNAKLSAPVSTAGFMAVVRLLLIVIIGSIIGYTTGISQETHNVLMKELSARSEDSSRRQLEQFTKTDEEVASTSSGIFQGNPMEMALFGIVTIWLLSSMLKSPLQMMVRHTNRMLIYALCVLFYFFCLVRYAGPQELGDGGATAVNL